MKRRRRVPTLLALLCTLATRLVAGEPPAPPKPAPAPRPKRPERSISLDKAVELALRRNLQLAARRLDPERAATVVVEQRAIFDPTAFSDFSRAKSNTQSSSGLSGQLSQDWTGEFGLQKLFPLGTQAEILASWARDWSDSPFATFDPSYTQQWGIELSQPLLRGFGIRVNVAGIDLAKNEHRMALAALHDTALGTVADTQKTYWELVFAIRDRKLLDDLLKQARGLREKILALVEGGEVGARDPRVAQAAAEVAIREEEMVVAQESIRDIEDVLKVITDLAADAALWQVALLPNTEPPEPRPSFDPDKAVQTALANRPDYLQAKLAIENQDIRIRVARNDLLPSLNLTAQLATTGLGPRWAESRYHVGSLDFYEGRFGLTFEYPLGNRAARARLRRAKLERQQSTYSLKATERIVQREVRRAVRQFSANIERLRASRLSVRAEEERLRAEQIRYKEAKLGTIQEVLDAQAALSDAKRRSLRALIDLNNSLVDVERAKGTLLEASRVAIEPVAPK